MRVTQRGSNDCAVFMRDEDRHHCWRGSGGNPTFIVRLREGLGPRLITGEPDEQRPP